MKKNTDYTIPLLISLFLFACFASSCGDKKQGEGNAKSILKQPENVVIESDEFSTWTTTNYPRRKIVPVDSLFEMLPKREIDQINVDKKGLISFTWIESDGSGHGLDGVTLKGFNHWLRGEIDSVYNDGAMKGEYHSKYLRHALDEGHVLQIFADSSFNIVGKLIEQKTQP